MKITESTSLEDLYKRQTEHFLKQIENVKVETFPYTHLEYDNFFTEEFYDYMKRMMPNNNDVIPLKKFNDVKPSLYKVYDSYSDDRFSLVIHDPTNKYELLDYGLKHPENKKKYVLLHRWFSEIFLPKISELFRLDVNNITGNEFLYVLDKEGYKLGAHTDVPQKVITMLIYLPDDDSMYECGTQVLVPVESEGLKGFKAHKVSKFIPKNTFAFLRSENSWHSVSEVKNNKERKLLLFTAVNKNVKIKPL